MRKFCAALLLVAWGLCAMAAQKSATVVYINGSKYYIHTVQPGETLYALSKEYHVGESVIRESNPSVAAEGLKAGVNIKIPFVAEVTERTSEKKLRKKFDMHEVTKGQTLYAISRKYEIPVQTIIEDNPNLDPIHLRLGERIRIRKKEKGSETEAGSKAGWAEYRTTLNSVAEQGQAYHLVHPGETFYSLSRRFGITEEQLASLNNGLKAADLRAGAIIKVPGDGQALAAAEATVAQAREQIEAAVAIGPVQEVLPPREELAPEEELPTVELRALQPGEPLDVALMLPLAVDGGAANGSYLDFYQGFLLALDSLKTRHGISVNVNLYNTGRNAERISQIIARDEFQSTDLIVGPVYEEGLDAAIRFAEQQGVPIISPLANLTHTNSDVVFQLAPDPEQKYAKVADLLDGSKQVTLIYSSSTDKEFEGEILEALGQTPHRKHTYKYVHPSATSAAGGPSDLTPLLEQGGDNLFVILSNNEVEVDRILAALASADTNLTARSRTTAQFMVLGNSYWINRYRNVDRTMFFKNRVIFLSNYHAKRDSQAVTAFDAAYIRAFGALPSLFSYRGYDAAAIFVPAMYGSIEYGMEEGPLTPLQTTYEFGRGEQVRNHVNRNWMRVDYNPDFTITLQ